MKNFVRFLKNILLFFNIFLQFLNISQIILNFSLFNMKWLILSSKMVLIRYLIFVFVHFMWNVDFVLCLSFSCLTHLLQWPTGISRWARVWPRPQAAHVSPAVIRMRSTRGRLRRCCSQCARWTCSPHSASTRGRTRSRPTRLRYSPVSHTTSGTSRARVRTSSLSSHISLALLTARSI